jgi:hypothetical protein
MLGGQDESSFCLKSRLSFDFSLLHVTSALKLFLSVLDFLFFWFLLIYSCCRTKTNSIEETKGNENEGGNIFGGNQGGKRLSL